MCCCEPCQGRKAAALSSQLMCVVRVPGGAMDAGNAWSGTATASVWIPKKIEPLSKDRGFFCACFVVSYKLDNYAQTTAVLLAVSGPGM